MAIVNNAAMNMQVQISLRYSVLITFEYIAKSQVTGWWCSSIFWFLRNLHTVSIGTIPYTFQPTRHSVSLFPLSLPTLVISGLLDGSHSNRHEMIDISLSFWLATGKSPMISDAEQLFMYLLTIGVYPLGKSLFRSSTHFKIQLINI